MKKYILYLSAIAGLAITGCRKIETDGEIQVVIVNGGGGSYYRRNNHFAGTY